MRVWAWRLTIALVLLGAASGVAYVLAIGQTWAAQALGPRLLILTPRRSTA